MDRPEVYPAQIALVRPLDRVVGAVVVRDPRVVVLPGRHVNLKYIALAPVHHNVGVLKIATDVEPVVAGADDPRVLERERRPTDTLANDE